MAPYAMRAGKSVTSHLPKVLCVGFLLACSAANAAAPVYFDLGGLVVGVFLLVVAVVLGIAYAIGRGKGVVAAIIFGGAYLGWWALQISGEAEADRSLNDWRRSAWQACEADHAALPKVIEAASVVDTTAGLVRTQLIQLLSERALEFVEVKVAEEPQKEKAIFLEDCCNGYGSSWIKAEWAKKPYLRLKLGKVTHPACRPELTSRYWKIAPFLPDTCLVAEEIDEPSADVRIEQLAARRTEPRAWGWRRLVDVKSGNVLAQLTSEEEQGIAGFGAGDRLTRPGERSGPVDCRKPHGLLADLLRNARGGPRPSQTQVLSAVSLQPNVPLDELLTRAQEVPRVEGILGEVVYLSEVQDWQIFGSEIRQEEWAIHIENARRDPRGVAPHGTRLIDLNLATLIKLDSGQEGHLNWWTHAALNGFFVANRKGRDGERLLVRFNRQGKLEWVVSIVVENNSSPGAEFEFQGAAIEGRELVLYDRGHLVQPKDREQKPADTYAVATAFRIPLNRLPPMEGNRP